MKDDALLNIREEIDKIDDQIVNYLNLRFSLALDVAEIKKDLGIPIFNAKREEEVLKNVSDKSRYKENVKTVFETIIEESKKLQRKD